MGAGEAVFNVSPHLTAEGRRRARKRGKSDGQDAEAVARMVLQESGELPEVTGEDETNVLGVLNGERELVKGEAARLQNHLRALLRQLDPVYERSLKSLTTKRTLAELKVYQESGNTPVQVARAGAVRRLGQQLELALGHMAEIAREMEERVSVRFKTLTGICGVDLLTAAQLAAEMGPGQRFTSDAALASWGGTAPIEASSGANVRHRLSRAGNRQFNAIVHRIAVTQLRYSTAAKAYVERRRSEGKTKRESMRALKRYIVRAIFNCWVVCFEESETQSAPITTYGCT